jgi:hypothetical protein
MRERRYSSTHSQPLPRYLLNRVGACRQSIHISSNFAECAVPAHYLAGLEERTSHAVDAAMTQHFYIAQTFDRVTRGPHDKRKHTYT